MSNNKTCKVLVVGPQKAGKTALLTRIVSNQFYSNLQPGYSVDFTKMTIKDVKFQFWDIPSRGDWIKQRSNHSNYDKNANQILIIFNPYIENNNLKAWVDEARKIPGFEGESKGKIFLVATHCDLDSTQTRVMSKEAAESLANENGLTYCEVSSKSNDGVDELRGQLIEEAKKIVNPQAESHSASNQAKYNRLPTKVDKARESYAKEQIDKLKARINENMTPEQIKAINKICDILELSLSTKLEADPKEYFNRQKGALDEALNTLATTYSSMNKTFQNAITAFAACLSVFGLFYMASKYAKTGNPALFWTEGDKQQAMEAIGAAKIESQKMKSGPR